MRGEQSARICPQYQGAGLADATRTGSWGMTSLAHRQVLLRLVAITLSGTRRLSRALAASMGECRYTRLSRPYCKHAMSFHAFSLLSDDGGAAQSWTLNFHAPTGFVPLSPVRVTFG